MSGGAVPRDARAGQPSAAGANDMLQSLYEQMRESRQSGDAANFGGWAAGFAGHGAVVGKSLHVCPHCTRYYRILYCS